MIKTFLSKILPIPIKKELKNFYILAYKYAQYKSIVKSSCINRDNYAIPWYTYPAIEYLCTLDFKNKSIFEFGSGNSSTFWANRSGWVVSVEHNKSWFTIATQNQNQNQTILLKNNKKEYLHAISLKPNKYDVIIIDGIYRSECARLVKNYLNRGGMVILDNSDWYKKTSKYLRNTLNLIEIDFHGFGPINGYTWTTSIYLSRDFNMKPIQDTQPHNSIGALIQNDETDY